MLTSVVGVYITGRVFASLVVFSRPRSRVYITGRVLTSVVGVYITGRELKSLVVCLRHWSYVCISGRVFILLVVCLRHWSCVYVTEGSGLPFALATLAKQNVTTNILREKPEQLLPSLPYKLFVLWKAGLTAPCSTICSPQSNIAATYPFFSMNFWSGSLTVLATNLIL